MALVVLGSALVGDGVAVLRGDLRGLPEVLLGRGLAAEVILGLGRHEVLGGDRGQADARLLDGLLP